VSLLLRAFRNALGILIVAMPRPSWALMVAEISMLSVATVGDVPCSFFVARLKAFLAAVRASVGANAAISFLDDVHEGQERAF
jgi:hypothetical protein